MLWILDAHLESVEPLIVQCFGVFRNLVCGQLEPNQDFLHSEACRHSGILILVIKALLLSGIHEALAQALLSIWK